MRVFTATSYEDRGQDAMRHNPGNLYFTYARNESLPICCPFRRELIEASRAQYVVCGPDGWALVGELGGGQLGVLFGPRPSNAVL
jgi:hypothetical protein